MNQELIPIKNIVVIDPDADPYVPIRIAPDRLRTADLSKLPRNLVLHTTVDRTTIHIRHIGNDLDVEIITAWAFGVPNRFQYLLIASMVLNQIANALRDTNLPKLYVSEPDEDANLSVSFRVPLNTPGGDLLTIADRAFNQIMEDMHGALDVILRSTALSAPIIDLIQ